MRGSHAVDGSKEIACPPVERRNCFWIFSLDQKDLAHQIAADRRIANNLIRAVLVKNLLLVLI